MVSLFKFAEQGDGAVREWVGSLAAPRSIVVDPDELMQSFQAEARTLSSLLSLAKEDDAATASAALEDTLRMWEQRLSGDAEDEGKRLAVPALMAFIRSQAIETALYALAGWRHRHLVLFHAAASASGNVCSSTAAATPEKNAGEALACLLLQTTAAPAVLMAEWLGLLARATEEADKCIRGRIAMYSSSAEDDVFRLLTVLLTLMPEGREAQATAGSRLCAAADHAVSGAQANVPQNGIVASLESAPASGSKLAFGNEVWACWPGDGCWYRAWVKNPVGKRVSVSWSRPAEVGHHSAEYLSGTGADDSLFTEVGRSAVILVQDSMRRPAPTIGEDLPHGQWDKRIGHIEAYGLRIRELRSLALQLECHRRFRSSSFEEADAEPPVCGAAGKLLLFRAEAGERSETLSALASESQKEASCYQEQMQTSTCAMEAELHGLQVDRDQTTRNIEALRLKRDELLQQLQIVSDDLLLAETTRVELDMREEALCASKVRVAAELAQQLEGAQECNNMATRRHELVNLAAGACRNIEVHFSSRAAAVAQAAPVCEELPASEDAVGTAFVASDRARQHELQELLVAWNNTVWGPDGGTLSRTPSRMTALRVAHTRALAAVEQALPVVEQVAAEEATSKRNTTNMFQSFWVLASSDNANGKETVPQQMSRALPQYKKMRKELRKNVERLSELESCTPYAAKVSLGGS